MTFLPPSILSINLFLNKIADTKNGLPTVQYRLKKTSLMTTNYVITALAVSFLLGYGFTLSTPTLSSEDDKVLSNGWTDILDIKEDIFTRFEETEDAVRAFEEEMHGRKVRFSGFLKQVRPHFAEQKDYYLTADMETDCLPFIQSECCYCGEENPDYMRVLFHGEGREKHDMDILLKPHRNRYYKGKGELDEKKLDAGNYVIYTFEKKFDLEANIKMCSVKCKSDECDEKYITVHLDRWEFLNTDK